MDIDTSDLLVKEWETLDEEFVRLQDTHKQYQTTAAGFIKLQSKCLSDVAHQKKRLKQMTENLKRKPEDRTELSARIEKRREELSHLEESLPRKNDLYLRIILDGINVSFIDVNQRYNFKEQYEKFKLIVSALILFVASLDLLFKYRAIDAVLHFLLVWYHCTLTIRESILIVNGSRIKGWWRFVQFIRTIKAGIFIVWPDGLMYNLFRTQFVAYHCYTTVIQFVQFNYQRQCLYRLRTLGERNDMDLTISGFHSWMWRGLTFLIPLLYMGYIFEFFNAITLYNLSFHKECDEWQVIVSAFIFLLLAVGNTYTTSLVVYQKFREKIDQRTREKEDQRTREKEVKSS